MDEIEKQKIKELIECYSLNTKKFSSNINSVKIESSHVVKLTINGVKFNNLKNLDEKDKKDISQEANINFLESFPYLEELNLYRCHLSNLEFIKKLRELKKIGIGGNQIVSLEPLYHLEKLQIVDAGRNLIQDCPEFPENNNIVSLNLAFNKISQIKYLSNLQKLKTLILSNNNIWKIENLDSLKSLEELYLDGNQIEKIEGLNSLTSLRILDLSNNNIGKIEGLGSLWHLEDLDLNENPLEPEYENWDKYSPQYWVNSSFTNSIDNNYLMPILSFIGHSHSGKTSSIESIVHYLKELDFEVIVLKNIHHPDFTLDTPGKNTWKYRESGAKIAGAKTAKEWAFYIPQEWNLFSILPHLRKMVISAEGLDDESPIIVILEGFRNASAPTILCVKNEENIEDIKEQWNTNIIALSGIISNNYDNIRIGNIQNSSIEDYFRIPILNLKENPGSLFKMIDRMNLPSFSYNINNKDKVRNMFSYILEKIT